MQANGAVLREYAPNGWRDRIVHGEAVAEVESWLARVELLPPLPSGGSGKPLAWLYLVAGDDVENSWKVLRRVGIQTDVLRVLDRSITAEELRRLRGIFEWYGRPFGGTLEDE